MKTFTVTINDDGTCAVTDDKGTEIGTFQSVEELTAGLAGIVGAETPVEPAEPQEEPETAEPAETPAQEAAEPPAGEEALAPTDGETNYAQKKGMRPKKPADMNDYFSVPGK